MSHSYELDTINHKIFNIRTINVQTWTFSILISTKIHIFDTFVPI